MSGSDRYRSRETECQFNKASVVSGSDSVDVGDRVSVHKASVVRQCGSHNRVSVQQGFCCESQCGYRSRETECQFNKASVVSDI